MNNDLTTRAASRAATVAAIPLALLAGIISFLVLRPAPTNQASLDPNGPAPTLKWPLTERQSTVCRDVLANLPEKLRDLSRREVVGGAEQNAAYGSPALTLSCGTSVPEFLPTELLFTMDDVCWLPLANGQAWVTVDREVAFTVMLPPELSGDGSGQWAKVLTPFISSVVPATETRPFGCG